MRLGGGLENRDCFKSHKNLAPVYDWLWGEGTNRQHDIFSEGHVEHFSKYPRTWKQQEASWNQGHYELRARALLSLTLHCRCCALISSNLLPFAEHLKLSLVSGASADRLLPLPEPPVSPTSHFPSALCRTHPCDEHPETHLVRGQFSSTEQELSVCYVRELYCWDSSCHEASGGHSTAL